MPTFCSPTCRVRAHEDANPEKAAAYRATTQARKQVAREARRTPCPWCDTPKPPTWKHCGKPDCKRKHTAKRQRDFKAAHKAETGQPYENRYAEQRRAETIRRKALSRGADGSEVFLPREVYERDGWVCGICTHPVDPELRYPDMKSASLDHVVPLSHGGPHTRANTRCSHLDCNVGRGNRVAA